MQRTEHRLKICLFIVFLLSGITNGQTLNTNDLLELYEQHRFALLKERIENLQWNYTTTQEYRFFNALFIEDGEKAQQEFKYIFDNADGRIKYHAAYKMMEYYFARGYYNTAGNYQKYLLDNEPGAGINADQNTESSVSGSNDPGHIDQVFIQVGAFGFRENALQLRNMLSTQNIDSKIIEREINDKKLFCVWVDGLDNLDDTLKFANEIKEKYDLDFRIIKR